MPRAVPAKEGLLGHSQHPEAMYGWGLHVLDDQSNEKVQGIEPVVDVVAVHGLNFKDKPNHAVRTWAGSSKQTPWVKEFLPDTLKRPCRIMLFAYNSSPAIGAAAMDLDDHAKELLRCLLDLREGLSQRPIMFLCHSLGGLVVKQALVEARLDPAYESIVHASRLLVFFATPHLGGNWSELGDIVAKLLTTGRKDRSNDLLEALKASSKDVKRRFEQSRHLPEHCLVISYYETEDYGKYGLGKIVEESSAVLNLPDNVELQVERKANHSKVCKFQTKEAAKEVMELISEQFERALEMQRAAQEQNVHWLVPSRVNPLFTGRDDTIQKVIKAIDPRLQSPSLDKKERVFVLTGIGGQGKSELCLHIANQVRKSFWGVFWIDVSSRVTATAGFTKVAQALGSETKEIDQVLLMLSNCTNTNNWLLVLDNADDEEVDYQDFIPSGNRGTVLLTSRLPECQWHNTIGHEELGSLRDQECVSLFLKSARMPDTTEPESVAVVEAITHEVGLHTLAIIQAGAYIALGNCKLDEYISIFQHERKKLLSFGLAQSKSRYRNVYATFEVSWQLLISTKTQGAQDALSLLDILSTFHHDGVPIGIFEDAWNGSKKARSNMKFTDLIDHVSSWHVNRLPDLIKRESEIWDEDRLALAISQLKSRALLRVDYMNGEETLSMHPLIHGWVAARQDQAQRPELIESSRCIVAVAQYSRVQWRPYIHQLEPHVIALLGSVPADMKNLRVAQIFTQICDLLVYLNCQEEVFPILEQIFLGADADVKHPVKNLLPVYHLLSLHQLSSGKVTESIDTTQKVLAIQESFLSEQHHDRLLSQQVLARGFIRNGQWREAISTLQKVRDVHENQLMLPKENEQRLALLHQLGSAYNTVGRTKEAIALLDEVVTIQEQTKNPADPGQIGSQFQLASALVSNGQTREAIELLRDLDEVQQHYLAKNHKDRVGLQVGLAKAYLEDGQPGKSIQICKEIMDSKKGHLPGDFGEGDTVTQILASAYSSIGRERDAVATFERIYRKQGRTTPHPQAFATRHGLGKAYLANGQTKKAIKVLEEGHAINDSVISKTHPSRVILQADLSRAYLADGQITKAIALLQKAIGLQEVITDKDNPNLLTLQQELGSAFLDNGQTKDAIQVFASVVALKRASRDRETDFGQLTALHELARAYIEDGQDKEAIRILDEVVRKKALVIPADHPEMLSSQHELARALLSDGKVPESIEMCERIDQVQKVKLRRGHPHQLQTMRLLASGYLANNQVADALKLLTEVDEMEQGQVQATHPANLATKHLIGKAYIQAGQIKNGLATLETLVRNRKSVVRESHPALLSAQHQLASAYMANGDTQRSVKEFQEVVRIQDTSLPRKHHSRLVSMHQLSKAYFKCGRPADALKLITEVVDLQQDLDEAHPSSTASNHELASCYLALGRVDDAVTLFQKLARIQTSTLRRDDPSRLRTIESLASAYLKQGNVRAAIRELEESVAVKQRALASGESGRVLAKHMLGMAYLEDGQEEKAIDTLEGVLQCERRPDEAPQPFLLKTYYELGCVYLVTRRAERAVERLEELSRLKKLHQDENYPSWDELNETLKMASRANSRRGRILISLGFGSRVIR